jgi:7,8-dihydropterin-6-yl-methyl-4-(beta-D-ribofuranosyl)aminobenzene 5'-phosphate synthase
VACPAPPCSARTTPKLGEREVAAEPLIPATVAALAAEDPTLLVPAHCTGWKAQQALATGLPSAYQPNSVGSRFEL